MIVCLGWGSLIWKPGGLPVGDWRNDGPEVQVEFVRESKDHRLTLVLDLNSADSVISLWAPMTVCDPNVAVTELADREGTGRGKIDQWSTGQGDPEKLPGLGDWATGRNINHVIWTALEPQFAGKSGVRPTEGQAVDHLSGLTGHERVSAEKYVRRAPLQIRTAYRSRFENHLGWSPYA